MGREIKRVPLDFAWPLNMPWKGYISPYRSQTCGVCEGCGLTPEAKRISDSWYDSTLFTPVAPYTGDHPVMLTKAQRNYPNSSEWTVKQEARRLAGLFNSWSHHLDQDDVDALLAADRLWNFTRVPLNAEQALVVKEKMERGENSWLPFVNGYHPTADEVNLWSLAGLGHDGINYSVCLKAKCARLGIELVCPFCAGTGKIWFSDKIRQLADDWYSNERYGPPVGDGWQVWETVSEGSPISPVFAAGDECVAWLVTLGYSEAAARSFVFARQRVMSATMVGGEFYKDIEAADK